MPMSILAQAQKGQAWCEALANTNTLPLKAKAPVKLGATLSTRDEQSTPHI